MPNSNLYLKSEWSQEKGILTYTVFSVSTSMMSYWAEKIIKDLASPKLGTTIRLLFDLSYPNVSMSYFVLAGRELFNVGITEEGRHNFIDILNQNPDTQFKLAVLLSHTMLGALAKHVPEKYGQQNFSAKIFFDTKKAEQWLVAEDTDGDVQTGILPTHDLEESLEKLANQDPDIFGNRRQLRMIVMGSLEVVSIEDDKPIVIGRGKDADLNVRDYGEIARSVSRQHAIITLKNGRLSITDLGSRNGTVLSGRKLEAGEEVYIRRDDIIQVGKMEMSVIF